jgi:hypothetical protein
MTFKVILGYVRVYATTAVCADNFNVYTDFGCAFPATSQPDLGTATIKTAAASYSALAPTIVSYVVSDINVTNLCDNKTIEIEIRNARLANIYKLKAGFKLPTGTTYVPNSAMIKYTATTATYTSIGAGDISFPIVDSLIIDLRNSNPFNTVCGLTGADTAILNTLRIKFDLSLDACPSSALSNMPYKVLGENYCGTSSSTRGNIRINYIGSGGNKNNYSLSPTTKELYICALKNQTQTVADTLFIKNEGGYGTSSGASSGLDEMTVAIPFDINSFTVTNFTVLAPFTSPVFGTNAQGQMTVKVLIPSGVAVGSSIEMPFTYDITMKKDSVCLLHAAPHFCFFAEFSTPLVLECAAKSLACNAASKTPVGTGISLRAFACCFVQQPIVCGMFLDSLSAEQIHSPYNSLTNLTSVLSDKSILLGGERDVYFYDLSSSAAPVGNGVYLGYNAIDIVNGTGEKSRLSVQWANNAVSTRNGWDVNLGNIRLICPSCTPPSVSSVHVDPATCTNGVANANAAVAVRGIAGMTKYAYRTNATDSLYALTATASTADSINLTGLATPSVSTTYTFRIWGIDTTCYNDTTVILTPSVCPLCSISATFTQGMCNNNGTTITATDDYFRVTVSSVSATNGGTSSKYEVVLNGTTVLNVGGTNYGSPVTVGTTTTFLSNGVTTYNLTVRDFDQPTCVTTAFTTAVSAACSITPCPTTICLPVTVTRE